VPGVWEKPAAAGKTSPTPRWAADLGAEGAQPDDDGERHRAHRIDLARRHQRHQGLLPNIVRKDAARGVLAARCWRTAARRRATSRHRLATAYFTLRAIDTSLFLIKALGGDWEQPVRAAGGW